MGSRKEEIREEDVRGLKYFRRLRPLLGRLHGVGCERDQAGNRDLHMDEYCVLVLLRLFSPLVDSLRGLQQASELEKVRKKLGVGRSSLGSLSESVGVFDPEPLKAIAAELAEQLPATQAGRFAAVGQELTAVDGSVVNTVARVARLAWLPKGKNQSSSAYRLHTHFEVLRGVPTRIDATPASPQGEHDERAVLERTIELFFRMFKQLLGCRHLLSAKQNGVEIQACCASIACLLILLHTGRTPTKRTFERINFYLVGWATLEELEAHIAKLKPTA
jgi:hypothetical protein